jgi:polysaccharide pyruvyl transferase WcaK-like protein
MKIALSGYYGMANYGDDLFCIAASEGAKQFWLSHETQLLCPPLDGVQANFVVPGFARDLYRRHDHLGAMCRSLFLLATGLSADKFVFAGGSIFSSGKASVRDLLFRARGNRKGYFSAIGVSVGPFQSVADEKKVRNDLSRFEYISVRDRESFEILKQFNLDGRLTASVDLVGSLYGARRQQPWREDRTRRLIGFSPCNLTNRTAEAVDYCDRFVSGLAQVANLSETAVELICLNEHPVVGDAGLCDYTRKKLSEIGIDSSISRYRDLGAFGIWDRIDGLDAYFTARLHGAITGYLSGVPFFLFERQRKSADFLDMIAKPECERVVGDNDNYVEAFRQVIFAPSKPGLDPEEFYRLSLKNFTDAPWNASQGVS